MSRLSPDRWHVMLPAFWAGGLVTIAAVATPAPFALLAQAEAGRVVGRILAHEAHASLAIGVVALLLERRAARRAAARGEGSQFSGGMVLALAAIFLTVLGYFALQPLMAAARAGHGAFTFGQLHLASSVCYGIKTLLVLALAWRNAAPPRPRAVPDTAASEVNPASS